MEPSLTEGIKNYRRRTRKAVSKKRESQTLYGRYAYKQTLDTLAEHVEKLVSTKSHSPKRFGAEWQRLKALKPLLVAHIVSTTVLDSLSTPVRKTTLASTVGHKLVDEINFIHLKVSHPKLWKKMQHGKNKRVAYKFKRIYLCRQADRHFGRNWRLDLSLESTVKVGLAVLQLFKQVTGLIDFEKQKVNRIKWHYIVVPTKHALKLIDHINKRGELLNPFYLPVEVEPRKWTNSDNGGYQFPPDVNWSFIKGIRKTSTSTDYTKALNAANTLQKTSHRVNPLVLGVSREMFRRRSRLLEEVDSRVAAFGETNDTRGYRRCQAKRYEERRKTLHETILTDNLLSLAGRFSEKEIYMPVQADFRGRLYYAPKYLNPQGTDLARGLLQFATPTSVRSCEDWFLVGGANSFGIKGSLEDRQQWALKNERQHKAIANDPLSNQGWLEAASPYPYLAWCFEFSQWITNRHTFRSSLPVRLDHHASGLQIVACLFEDKHLMKLTNLSDAPKPTDFYVTVLEKLKKFLGKSTRPEDHRWLGLQIDRKLIKGLTVSYMYGGSNFGLEQVIKSWYVEQHSDAFGKDFYKEANNLRQRFQEALDDVSSTPTKFLKHAREMQTDEPLSLESPSGFVISNDYKKHNKVRLVTTVNNEKVDAKIRVPTTEFNKRAATQALPANLVHTYDSAVLHSVLADNEWEQIVTLHDCYGIPPKDCVKCVDAIKNAMETTLGVDMPKRMWYAAS